MNLYQRMGALGALLSLACAPLTANADLMLRLSDGINTVNIVDGGFGDVNGAVGAVTYVGGVGAFTINVSTAIGDAQTAYRGIHFDSISNSQGAGSIQISMTETNLNFGVVGPFAMSTSFGGIAGGTIQGRVFVDDANVAFAQATQVFDSGLLGSGAFARAGSELVSLTDPFSMSMVIDITHLTGTSSSFNFDSRVPEPGTFALLGISLLGLGAAGRRKKA